jgi:hypothetical protein
MERLLGYMINCKIAVRALLENLPHLLEAGHAKFVQKGVGVAALPLHAHCVLEDDTYKTSHFMPKLTITWKNAWHAMQVCTAMEERPRVRFVQPVAGAMPALLCVIIAMLGDIYRTRVKSHFTTIPSKDAKSVCLGCTV